MRYSNLGGGDISVFDWIKTLLGIITVGVFTFTYSVQPVEKAYIPGSFYSGQNDAYLSYHNMYGDVITESKLRERSFDISNTIPDMSNVPLPPEGIILSEIKIFDTDTFVKIDNKDKKWEEESEFTFILSDGPHRVYSPFDSKITGILPNVSKGLVPLFETYFKDGGVTINLIRAIGDKTYNITLSKLEKTWQSFYHTNGCKEVHSGRVIYYTDYPVGKQLSVSKGAPIAFTGRTGGIPEDDGTKSYIHVAATVTQGGTTKVCKLGEVLK